MCMFTLIVSTFEPNRNKEAMDDHAWIEAIHEELHQLNRIKVWELVDKPFGKTVINLKWLWKNKKDEDNIVIRNEARLVAKEYHWEEGLGSLPSNIIPDPREDLKAITTQSSVTLAGPSVSPPPSKEVDREPETITDQVLIRSTNNVPPLVVQPSLASTSSTPISSPKILESNPDQPLVAQTQVLIDEPVVALKPKRTIPYPSRVTKQKLRKKDDNLALKFVEIFRNLHFELSFADTLLHMPNPTPTLDLIISFSSPLFTPFEGSDFILEEMKTFLRTPDDLSNLDDDYYDTKGDILYLEKLINEDPSPNLPPVKTEDLKQVDATITKPSIEGIDKLPVIISKELKDKEKSTLLKGFAAALAILITEASQSRKHGKSELSCFLDIQLASLSPKNCIPLEVLLRVSRQPVSSVSEKVDSGFKLTTFSDTDDTGCLDTRKSTSRGIQFLGDKLASWMSKKQDYTIMSTVEAEYVALSVSYAQALWMRIQLKDY
nr:reverse transcriptase domain-containing protein [Tanacetum cinerariifolium]